MTSVQISNRSHQDVEVTLIQEGKRKMALVPRRSVKYFADAEPTAELKAIHESKNLNVTYRVIKSED